MTVYGVHSLDIFLLRECSARRGVAAENLRAVVVNAGFILRAGEQVTHRSNKLLTATGSSWSAGYSYQGTIWLTRKARALWAGALPLWVISHLLFRI